MPSRTVTTLSVALLVAVGASSLGLAAGGGAVQIRRPDGLSFAAAFEPGLGSDTLVVTRVGARSESYGDDSSLPRRWAATHASLTVSPFGPGFASSGMNDAGLTIHLTWRDGTSQLSPVPLLETLQWVQFCLDRFEKVSEVVHSATATGIVGKVPAQILTCDANGVCGIVEKDGDEIVERWAERLPLPLLTGATYAQSLEFLNRTLGYGGAPTAPEGNAAPARFARAATAVNRARSAREAPTVEDIFAVLEVAAPEPGLPQRVVYDQAARRVHLRRSGSQPQQRSVAIAEVGGTCSDSLPPVALVTFAADGTPDTMAVPAGGVAEKLIKGSSWVDAGGPISWTEVGAVSDSIVCLAAGPDADPHGSPHGS